VLLGCYEDVNYFQTISTYSISITSFGILVNIGVIDVKLYEKSVFYYILHIYCVVVRCMSLSVCVYVLFYV